KKLNNILARCLEKNLDLRYQSMDEALEDLSRVGKNGAAALDLILPAAITEVRRRGRVFPLIAWLVVGTSVLAVAGIIRYWYSAKPYQVLSITRITNRGDVSAVALSPDGNRLAYAAEEGTTGSLHLLEIGTDIDAERVAHYSGKNIGITFSPDGRFIFY